jgi:hypothetical protein
MLMLLGIVQDESVCPNAKKKADRFRPIGSRGSVAHLAIKSASEKRTGNSKVIDSPKTANFLFFVDPSL